MISKSINFHSKHFFSQKNRFLPQTVPKNKHCNQQYVWMCSFIHFDCCDWIRVHKNFAIEYQPKSRIENGWHFTCDCDSSIFHGLYIHVGANDTKTCWACGLHFNPSDHSSDASNTVYNRWKATMLGWSTFRKEETWPRICHFFGHRKYGPLDSQNIFREEFT